MVMSVVCYQRYFARHFICVVENESVSQITVLIHFALQDVVFIIHNFFFNLVFFSESVNSIKGWVKGNRFCLCQLAVAVRYVSKFAKAHSCLNFHWSNFIYSLKKLVTVLG